MRGDQRRVAGVNAQLTSLARQGHKPGFAGKDGLFRADNIDVNGVHKIPNVKDVEKAGV